jgi:hypothetical protein
MKGDFSRDTFYPRKHYAGVLMQQGRVQLDADWNEQQDIARHRAETGARDVVGESGAPVHNAGFKLSTPDGAAVTIGQGRYYVGGVLCENEADVDYTQQPDLPNAPAIVGALQAAGATVAILYLDVWRRAITALDDPEIREVALGGPDTAIRARTIWQVKTLPVKPAAPGGVSCGDSFPEWDALTAPGTGLLSARSQPAPATSTPDLLPPSAGYQRLENQLYRVEIHQGGAVGTATFKWSRDNGSVLTAIEAFNGQQLTVHDLGRDANLGFSNGQSVELISDAMELAGQPGQFFTIDHVIEASRTVVLTTAPTAVALSANPKLRRWDAPPATLGAALTADGWTVLESGVQVKFEAGAYNPGDFWTFAARTVTADVDWPFATPQPPRGEGHRFARLAIATLSGGALTLQDCRKIFTPIAEVPPALHVSGISWVHDDVLVQAQLQTSGLQLFFDGALTPPPGDAAQAVLTVTMETPVLLKTFNAAADPAAQITLDVPLSATLSYPTTNTILWKPGADFANLAAMLVGEQVQRVRMRVHLEGSAIYSPSASGRVYLDGRALGQDGIRADGTPRIDLVLPSGEGRRSSNFDSWFYLQLQLPPATLTSISVAPLVINGGASATGTVTFNHPAPAAGIVVNLTSSLGNVVVPATVQVAVGATSATFNITTTAAANTLDAVISATSAGVTVTAQVVLQVVQVAVTPAAVTIFTGHSQQFSATVSGAATGASTAVTWSVTEAGGGGVDPSGLYTAGGTVGDFHIVATSVADPSKTGAAIAHVRLKTKDKEKEKEKDKEREKAVLKEVAMEKIKDLDHVPLRDVQRGPLAVYRTGAGASASRVAAVGRAFIQAARRPSLTPRTGA